ncbi:MAG: hypothetical protein ACI84C_001712 [Flavobacteriales bacterium]|jgi:hypothetical protein
MIDKIKTLISSATIQATHKDISSIKSKKLSYLKEDALLAIKRQALRVDQEGIKGIILEAGCALGGSAILIGLNKDKQRELRVYDVFGMIPPPSTDDGKDVTDRYEVIKSGESKGIDGGDYYGYEDELKKKVEHSFEEFGLVLSENAISLNQGLFEDTMNFSEKIAFAHIDCDWYESVKTCLDRIMPNLSIGGTAIIDDYYIWSGCTKATDEFLANNTDKFSKQKIAKKLHITRISD